MFVRRTVGQRALDDGGGPGFGGASVTQLGESFELRLFENTMHLRGTRLLPLLEPNPSNNLSISFLGHTV